MKITNRLLVALALSTVLVSCGPSESELRSELRAIDGELMSIRISMNQHRSQMSQSEVAAFFGAYAAGYGATSGDYGLATDGAITTSEAIHRYDVSGYSLNQLRARYFELSKRRMIVADKLK